MRGGDQAGLPPGPIQELPLSDLDAVFVRKFRQRALVPAPLLLPHAYPSPHTDTVNHLPIAERIELAIAAGDKAAVELALDELAPRGRGGRKQPDSVVASYDYCNREASALVDQDKLRRL